MTIRSSDAFQYIKVKNGDKRLFCLQQSFPVLASVLFFKKDFLSPLSRDDKPSGSSIRRILGFFWRQCKNFKTQFTYLMTFYGLDGKREEISPPVHLPLYGNICVPVHQGYKIFDFQRKVVAKVFDVDVNPASIGKEIDGLKKAALFDFSPSLKRWSVEERWYEEELVSGTLDSSYKPMDSREVVRKFSKELVPILNKMILLDPPLVKNSLAYAEEIVGKIGNSRLAKCEGTQKEYTGIKNFVDSILTQLESEGDASVFLVFTHGDFCPANMLNTKRGMKIIDWEWAEARSLFFDVYSYFFYRPVSRNISVGSMVSELNACLASFIPTLEKSMPNVAPNFEKGKNVYRWLFYIEQICKEVEREATDKNLNILNDIFRSLDVFTCCEKMMAPESEVSWRKYVSPSPQLIARHVE